MQFTRDRRQLLHLLAWRRGMLVQRVTSQTAFERAPQAITRDLDGTPARPHAASGGSHAPGNAERSTSRQSHTPRIATNTTSFDIHERPVVERSTSFDEHEPRVANRSTSPGPSLAPLAVGALLLTLCGLCAAPNALTAQTFTPPPAVVAPLPVPAGSPTTGAATPGVSTINAPQPAATQRGFVAKTLRDDTGTHRYQVFVPENYRPGTPMPVLVFLHGAGERGTDGLRHTRVGLGPLLKDRVRNFPFLVVFPQVEETHGRILTAWDPKSKDGARVYRILDEVRASYTTDPKRTALTGWSMGGYGALLHAAAFPERWTAVAALSGGATAPLANRLKGVPLWLFHGTDDLAVRVEESRALATALSEHDIASRYTEIVDGDHDIWQSVYDDDNVFDWLLDPSPSKPATVKRRTRAPLPRPDSDVPFITELEIPNAAYVRLGNDALNTVAQTIPLNVPPELLTGWLSDITDSTTVQGFDFDIYFRQISYRAQLSQVQIKSMGPGRLAVHLAIGNITIQIGQTQVAGNSKSAVAGPMSIGIGHAGPVWLSFEAKPYVENRELKLQLLGQSFQIPANNFYVTPPAGVNVRGFGMTREKVSNGLVNGLNGSRGRIEQQVQAIVPKLVGEVSRYLTFHQADRLVAGVWPFPVYQPRVKTWPSDIRLDQQGLTVLLGVSTAAPEPSLAPKEPRRLPAISHSTYAIPSAADLRVGVSPQILKPMSEMVARADLARIHVADTPSKSLAQLADIDLMSEAIPELKRFGEGAELWTELVIMGSASLGDAEGNGVKPPRVSLRGGVTTLNEAAADALTSGGRDGTDGHTTRRGPIHTVSGAAPSATASEAPRWMELHLPKIRLAMSVKTPDKAERIPVAYVDAELRHLVRPELVKPTSISRALGLNYHTEPSTALAAAFVEGYAPQDNTIRLGKIAPLLEQGWRELTIDAPSTQMKVPDLDFGVSKLRLADVQWTSPYVTLAFGMPGVKLTNSSAQPVRYQTRGPTGTKAGPFTLAPGKSHEFDIAFPLVFQRLDDGKPETLQLPVGSHSEFLPHEGKVSLFQARDTVKPAAP